MNNDDRNHLVAKYKKGETTLDEEQHLYKQEGSTDPSIDAWFTFVKKNKTEVPEDLNDRLWESFPAQKKTQQRRWTGGFAIAAAVVLLIALSIGFWNQEKLSYAQKEALLNEALAMFPEEETEIIEQTIIYENDMLILYTSTE